MSRFDNTKGWRLVRPVEIREPADPKVNDREFQLILRPERFNLDLEDVTVRHFARWREVYPKGRDIGVPSEKTGHEFTSSIMAKTRLDNDVTLFTIEEGAFLRWRHDPVSVEIYPLPPSRPWGTGGEFDGMMEADEMPAQGVLHGDPGRLSYYPTMEAIGPRIPGMTRGLFLSLYIDAAVFDRLVAQITNGARRITTIQASVRIELFQHEVDRFFDEHVRRSDLGMLGRGIDKSAHAIARLEGLSVSFAVDLPRPVPEDEQTVEDDEIPRMTPPDPAAVAAERIIGGQASLARAVRLAAWGLGASTILAAIIIATGT